MKICISFVFACVVRLAALSKAHSPPNIIFAMADDLGWGDVQYNGGNALTPNLDEMAQSANTILLQRYYSGGPVCSPTRGTVLTGRNHNRYCVWTANAGLNSADYVVPEQMPLPLSEITVAEVLRDANYSTALFGKWHLGDFKKLPDGNKKWPVSHPGLHGFEQWWATERSAPTCTLNCACFDNSTCFEGHWSGLPPCTNYHTNKSGEILNWPEGIAGDDSKFIWSLAESYIKEKAQSGQPFFLYLPFHTVHIRYIATEPYREMYLQKNYTSDEADYYGAITELDVVIGELRELLSELGIRNNTLLWFASDNGPAPNTPGVTNGLRGRKTMLWEGGVRVPGMIEWPDVIRENKESYFPVVSSDLLPTVYDILNIEPYDNRPLDGISILPFLQGKITDRNHSIFWAYDIDWKLDRQYNASVSGDRYKLMVIYDGGVIVDSKLYDLIDDQNETTDIKDKFPDYAKALQDDIEQWMKSVIDSINTVGCLNAKQQ